MEITPFAIEQIAKKLKDIHTGKTWVTLFNSCGARDVYDELGLPNIGKPMDNVHQSLNTSQNGY